MSEPSAAPVSLAQMLARRDARAVAQQGLLAQHRRPLLQLTLVNPGTVKDTAQSRALFVQGLAAIDGLLTSARLQVLARVVSCEPTGPEALLVVDAPAQWLKRRLVELEDQHPLGRLWDADVLDLDGLGVTRSQLGLPMRRCLLCGEPAHACARSAAHTLADLQRVIAQRWRAHAGTAAA